MAVISKDLGAVTAYAAAVNRGYTGTKEEFETLMASYAYVGEQAAESASNASQSATNASQSAQNAETAKGTAQQAATDAQSAQASAQGFAQSAQQSAQSASQSAQSAESAKNTAVNAVDGFAAGARQALDSVNQAGINWESLAEAQKLDSEAWALGTRDGEDVGSSDPAYHNNAKYYAEQTATDRTAAQTAAQTATQKASDAQASASAAAESARTLTIDATLTQSGQAADAKVTGDKTTGLKEDLNDSQIVSIVDLTNYIQGYIIASTGAVSTNSDLGRVDGIVLRKGSKVAVTARGYGANIAMIYRCNSDGTYTCLVASDGGSIKTYEYTATENVVVGLSFYVGSYSRDAKVVLAVSDALNEVTPKYNYLIVGTGKQYADIKSAINAVTNPSASNRYVIYVYGGQYNTYDSSQLSSSYNGLILPDYTDIVGIGNRDNIVLYFRGTAETSDYNNNISTLNVGGHNTVENITIIGKHCRYAVHDDFLAHSETEQIYKNVKFLVEAADSSAMASASSNIPYGCGAEIRKKLTFKNCIFENKNNKADFFYHDITAAVMIIGAVITFMNCRFIDGRYSIQLTNYNTPKESRIYLYGCKADNGGFIKGGGTSINTMYISGFANQGFAFTGNGTISQEDIDACIDLI